MQHYKVCCSKQFPLCLPQACPCCILCATCVKTAARIRALVVWSVFGTEAGAQILPFHNCNTTLEDIKWLSPRTPTTMTTPHRRHALSP